MLKILLDHNFNHRILHGLNRRIPNLDFVTTQILSKERETDQRLLKLANEQNRVMVTHDKRTFPKYAAEAIARGQNMAGVLIVPSDLSVGEAIKELEIIIQCSRENEFRGRVEFLPIFS